VVNSSDVVTVGIGYIVITKLYAEKTYFLTEPYIKGLTDTVLPQNVTCHRNAVFQLELVVTCGMCCAI
jgi:hypothetical protein